MSLANLSESYSLALFHARTSQDQMRDFEELIAQWFLDSNLGAREFLMEIGKAHRETCPRVFDAVPTLSPPEGP